MSALEFLEHHPYSPRAEASAVKRLHGFGTPGETVAFSVSVRSANGTAELKVRASGLTGDSTTIDAGGIEAYVVKSWDVSGVGVYQSARMTVGELLLKDDRAPLDDGYLEHPRQGAGSASPLWLYRAPDVRLAGEVRTSLSAGEPKQFWLSVKIPVDAPAACYTGALEFETSVADCERLPVELEVLPFTLLEAPQDLLLWYRGSIDPQQAQFYVPPELFRRHLQDIYEHGFRSISIGEKERTMAQQAIDMAEEVGFDRNIVFRQIPFNAEALRFTKLRPVYLLSDEIDAQWLRSGNLSDAAVAAHRGHGVYCDILKWVSMATLVGHDFVRRFENDKDIGHRPAIVSLAITGNRDFFARNESFAGSLKYYYWYSHMEKPNLHRVLSGVYLWKTGADGIAPYCYQHAPAFPFSPFDDFDAWEPLVRVGKFRDQMTVYPAMSGVIPTVQWEGMREGITDLRYLTTLDYALGLAGRVDPRRSGSPAGDARRRRDDFLSRIVIDEIEVESGAETEPYPRISAVEYHEFRRRIAADIGELYAQASGCDIEKRGAGGGTGTGRHNP